MSIVPKDSAIEQRSDSAVTPSPAEPLAGGRSVEVPSTSLIKRIILSGRAESIITAIVLMIPSLVWAYERRVIFPWDQAVYASVTVELWYALTHNIQAWQQLMI